MTVRLGLLSTASINGAILAARSGDAPFAVTAVGSRDAGRAGAYAAEHGIERAHGSYDELLADREVDAVYIALPNALHHEWTMRALAAGKHVLCEKPYTRRPDEVDEGSAFGAALLGGIAGGLFADAGEAIEACVRVRDVIDPEPAWSALYAERRERFRALYPALKAVLG